MKITTTIYEILHSELINVGKNEFFNDNQISFYDDKHAFIKKIMRLDDDVKKIIDMRFFQNIKLYENDSDKAFKQTFLNRFLNRQIAFQTVEVFSSQVVYVLLSRFEFINTLFNNLNEFVKNKHEAESTNESTDKTDSRQLFTTLPQDEVNLDVDNTQLRYGDENTISRNKNVGESSQNNVSTTHNLDNLIKTHYLIDEVFNDFDKKCFLQIW